MPSAKRRRNRGRTIRLLYIGRRITTRNRLAHFSLRADDGQQWNGTAKPLVAEHRPGAVIELTLNQAGDGWFIRDEHQPVLAGSHQDESEVLDWQVADRAAYTKDRARNRSAARDQPDPLLEHLAPVREALRQLPAPRRSAAIANLLTSLLGR